MKKNNRRTNSGNAPETSCSEPVVLDEDIELADAGALHEQLKKVAQTKCSVVLDGSQVKVVDTAILQLLVTLNREAQQNGSRVSWQQPSDTLCKAAALLGLESHLGLASTGK